MTTSSCNAQRQIHVCSQKQHVGASAKNLVNMPYKWRSNFHRGLGDAIEEGMSYIINISSFM